MSGVTCQVSGVRCHLSDVRCQMSCVRHNYYSFYLFLEKVVGLVGGGSVINGPTSSSFLRAQSLRKLVKLIFNSDSFPLSQGKGHFKHKKCIESIIRCYIERQKIIPC